MLLALALQAAIAGPPVEIPRKLRATPDCTPREGEDIVVCGQGPERFRLGPLPKVKGMSDPGLPMAAMQIGPGVGVAAEVEQGNIGNTPTNRLMMRLKLKF